MKTAYNIDEFNISNFCVNTFKAFNKHHNKFHLFKHLLHTFHLDDEMYENSFEDYASYISFVVIRESLIENKNILTYEQYVFNVLSGFYKQKYDKLVDSKLLAKIWSNIVFIFNYILNKSSSSDYNNIYFFERIYTTFSHINNQTNFNSYYFDVPIIYEKENGYDVLLILPKINNLYYNIVINFLLKYYKNKLHNIFVIELDTQNNSYETTDIAVNNVLLNSYRKYNETLYIDFNKINYQNCSLCPLSCTRSELLNTRFEITPFNKNKKLIRTIKI